MSHYREIRETFTNVHANKDFIVRFVSTLNIYEFITSEMQNIYFDLYIQYKILYRHLYEGGNA